MAKRKGIVEADAEVKRIKEELAKKEKEKATKEKEIIRIKAEAERAKTKLVKKYFAVYNGPRKSITLAPRIGRVVRGVPFEITEDDANTFARSNFAVSVRNERIKI